MKLSELVPSKSKYLAKEDVGEEGKNLTIKGFKREKVRKDNGGEEDAAVMYFEEGVKPMILNKTNLNRLGNIFKEADDTSDLKGKTVNVYNDPDVEFGGKIVGGLRIRRVKERENQTAVSQDEQFDDDIPF